MMYGNLSCIFGVKYKKKEGLIYMSRRARQNLRTSFFHVIVQGINKESIFKKDQYKEKYLKLIEDKMQEYDLDILAYAIMNTHAHLLIHIEKIKMLSEFMKKINEEFANYYNYKENRVGYVFRDRFLSEPIYTKCTCYDAFHIFIIIL